MLIGLATSFDWNLFFCFLGDLQVQFHKWEMACICQGVEISKFQPGLLGVHPFWFHLVSDAYRSWAQACLRMVNLSYIFFFRHRFNLLPTSVNILREFTFFKMFRFKSSCSLLSFFWLFCGTHSLIWLPPLKAVGWLARNRRGVC